MATDSIPSGVDPAAEPASCATFVRPPSPVLVPAPLPGKDAPPSMVNVTAPGPLHHASSSPESGPSHSRCTPAPLPSATQVGNAHVTRRLRRSSCCENTALGSSSASSTALPNLRTSFSATFGTEHRKLEPVAPPCPVHSYTPVERLSTLKSHGAVSWKTYHHQPPAGSRVDASPPHSYALLGSTLKTVGAASWGRQERALLRSSHIDSSSPHSYAAPLSTLRTSGAVAWREPHKPRELPPISHHKGGSMSAPASCTATPQKLRAGSPVAQPATSVSCTTTPYRLRRGQAAGRQLPCLGPNLGMGQSVSAPKRRARSKPPSDAPTGG